MVENSFRASLNAKRQIFRRIGGRSDKKAVGDWECRILTLSKLLDNYKK